MLRITAAALISSLATDAWLAGFMCILVLKGDPASPIVGGFAISGAVFFVPTFLCFAVFGVPGYLICRRFLRRYLVPIGILGGFILGMLASDGFAGLDSWENALEALPEFGVAGILGAIAFLIVVRDFPWRRTAS